MTHMSAHHTIVALPTKPLHSVPISDADTKSALAFVAKKLEESGLASSFTTEQTKCISRLGGRSSDLEAVSGAHHCFPVSLLKQMNLAYPQSPQRAAR